MHLGYSWHLLYKARRTLCQSLDEPRRPDWAPRCPASIPAHLDHCPGHTWKPQHPVVGPVFFKKTSPCPCLHILGQWRCPALLPDSWPHLKDMTGTAHGRQGAPAPARAPAPVTTQGEGSHGDIPGPLGVAWLCPRDSSWHHAQEATLGTPGLAFHRLPAYAPCVPRRSTPRRPRRTKNTLWLPEISSSQGSVGLASLNRSPFRPPSPRPKPDTAVTQRGTAGPPAWRMLLEAFRHCPRLPGWCF